MNGRTRGRHPVSVGAASALRLCEMPSHRGEKGEKQREGEKKTKGEGQAKRQTHRHTPTQTHTQTLTQTQTKMAEERAPERVRQLNVFLRNNRSSKDREGGGGEEGGGEGGERQRHTQRALLCVELVSLSICVWGRPSRPRGPSRRASRASSGSYSSPTAARPRGESAVSRRRCPLCAPHERSGAGAPS